MRAMLIALSLAAGLAACADSEPEGPEGPPIISENAVYSADPQPYDPALDAQAAIDRAFAQARGENKRVLIKMGGNWCPDCRILAGMTEIPEIADLIAENYAVVKVDVGRYDRNMDVPQRFGMEELEGVPTLLIVTPEGRVLNAAEPSIFRNARERDPQDFANYLYRYAEMPAS